MLLSVKLISSKKTKEDAPINKIFHINRLISQIENSTLVKFI